MVKLATARECRAYSLGGSGAASRNRWEYINAGVYVFAAILLVGGFLGQLVTPWGPGWSTRGALVVAAIGLAVVVAVNLHDLLAHVAGVDYRLGMAAGLDSQLALVEIAVPIVQIVGTVLMLVSFIFFEIQMERGYSHGLARHGLNLLIAGPALWCLGSVHNICQVYERASGHVQLLQKSVQIPLLLGSTLFLVAGIVNRHDRRSRGTAFMLLGRSWAWFCLIGSLLFLAGGVLNLLKVFKTQQMGGRGMEKLRGGAQERLAMEREGKVPLILEHGGGGRRGNREPPVMVPPPPPQGSYKDALVSSAS
ncbi:hypothetical protein HU200_046902 [Digitaria exilis]|uniref:Uncharacterized protein n=1 Tax=Digitaria exilis TaxID=1010633 RepID=A0A835EAR1_9POAL|nr:hypothetical protein HU200_046902 [Digitaria exilis]CAB3446312.1 unnamed protein product [Digitaria exilis]